jgi:dienelactone hydrolase
LASLHRTFLCAVLLLPLLLAGCVSGGGSGPSTVALSSTPGPQGTEDLPSRRQLWLIPSPVDGILMRATLFRPAGDGPFPLALINHGSDQDAIERSRMPIPEFAALTEWFVARGYAVLVPQRPGHGETGGRYLEDQGRCSNANFERSGRATADSISAAIDFMTGQSFIKPDGIVVVGNSAGGWGALALASRNPQNVRAVINFSGGRGGRNLGKAGKNCSPKKLVATAGAFGRAARIPSLWLYAENDSYFPPDLSNRMAESYRAAGGAVEFHILPPATTEGHNLIQTSGPAATWAPYVEKFLLK